MSLIEPIINDCKNLLKVIPGKNGNIVLDKFNEVIMKNEDFNKLKMEMKVRVTF